MGPNPSDRCEAPSRFDPLPRILYHADFDLGFCGFGALIGNYEGSLEAVLPEFRDLRPPMLSTATVWDIGSSGGWDGTYVLKLATRPQAGSLGVAVKRLTWRRPGRIRLEACFTFKPEAATMEPSATDVRAVGFGLDLQDGDRRPSARRVLPHLRYLNATGGRLEQRWQFKRVRAPMHQVGPSGLTRSHFHLAPQGWEDVPDGAQRLCHNEITTKQNWHYVRIGFDLDRMAFTEFACNDRTFDAAALAPMVMDAMPNLWCMLNTFMWVETDVDRRAFLYVDSVLLSAD
ncbi:MAG: DUF6772 family protein [Armatimonadota bacterium]|nr:DUF6772 family protein [Armatimonadota bacterium]